MINVQLPENSISNPDLAINDPDVKKMAAMTLPRHGLERLSPGAYNTQSSTAMASTSIRKSGLAKESITIRVLGGIGSERNSLRTVR